MVEQYIPNHYIQKYILSILTHQQYARFRDMRPPKVDTNLYSYHLKLLQKRCMIQKTDGGYTLDKAGMLYIDRVSAALLNIRTQPKIITMIMVQNTDGDVLLQKRTKQPYINSWTLPYGKLHIDDASVQAAARREAYEKLGAHDLAMRHMGDCYIRVQQGGELLTTTLAHVFYAETNDIVLTDGLIWVRPHKLGEYQLAPAVEQVVARTLFRDPFFFEEFTENLL
ncbi:MAG: NUDIX hydrolase [Candidatus Saccharibacteria bacterium]|nr:NUDIX hydrolase [Candidatus Saccharibacteria bacterium]